MVLLQSLKHKEALLQIQHRQPNQARLAVQPRHEAIGLLEEDCRAQEHWLAQIWR